MSSQLQHYSPTLGWVKCEATKRACKYKGANGHRISEDSASDANRPNIANNEVTEAQQIENLSASVIQYVMDGKKTALINALAKTENAPMFIREEASNFVREGNNYKWRALADAYPEQPLQNGRVRIELPKIPTYNNVLEDYDGNLYRARIKYNFYVDRARKAYTSGYDTNYPSVSYETLSNTALQKKAEYDLLKEEIGSAISLEGIPATYLEREANALHGKITVRDYNLEVWKMGAKGTWSDEDKFAALRRYREIMIKTAVRTYKAKANPSLADRTAQKVRALLDGKDMTEYDVQVNQERAEAKALSAKLAKFTDELRTAPWNTFIADE